MIHSIPTGYSIDGNRGIRDPRGMFGDQLGVHMPIITASAGAVRNVSTCIQRCHLEPPAFLVSPYAYGLASLVADALALGATVIALGGGATPIAVFYEHNDIFTNGSGTGLETVCKNAIILCAYVPNKK